LRRPASSFPSITGLRLSPHGAEAALVDLSPTGLLAECAIRLKVGSAVQVLFEGGFSPSTVAGRVARCEVASMGRDGALRYHIGVGFNSPIVLDDEPAPEPATVDLAPDPVVPLPIPPAAPAPPLIRNRW
jgi:hypothetical protein